MGTKENLLFCCGNEKAFIQFGMRCNTLSDIKKGNETISLVHTMNSVVEIYQPILFFS